MLSIFIASLAPLMAASGPEAVHPAGSVPAQSTQPVNTEIPDPKLLLTGDPAIEQGKALYENGQYMAALGKFMAVLRRDSRNTEARQYLRLVVDALRQNPVNAGGTKANVLASEANEQLRQLMKQRSLFTLDLRAIPGVKINLKGSVAQVEVDTNLLFAEGSGGLKEGGIPVLDRVTAWLKTFGQQPIIIHLYPEELQDPSVSGTLFLQRYTQLANFFIEERKLSPQRFISADLLKKEGDEPTETVSISTATGTPRVVIETVGSQSAFLDAMPSASPRHTLTSWVELSLISSRAIFNPEEGEWTNLDMAALTRKGLRTWVFKITPADGGKKAPPVLFMEGKGNLLKRIGWDGHDEKSGSFVRAGAYRCRLIATDADGTVQTRELVIQVQRTTRDEPIATARAPRKSSAKPSKPKPVAKKPAVSTEAPAETSAAAPAAAADSSDSDRLIDPPAEPAETEPATEDSGDSVHAIWKKVIEFEPNDAELKPTLRASLETIGKTLEVYPLQKVRIVGFATATESPELAKQRAEAVRSVLVDQYRVDKKRVIVGAGRTGASVSKVEMSITN